jgi:hypothetical protein
VKPSIYCAQGWAIEQDVHLIGIETTLRGSAS